MLYHVIICFFVYPFLLRTRVWIVLTFCLHCFVKCDMRLYVIFTQLRSVDAVRTVWLQHLDFSMNRTFCLQYLDFFSTLNLKFCLQCLYASAWFIHFVYNSCSNLSNTYILFILSVYIYVIHIYSVYNICIKVGRIFCLQCLYKSKWDVYSVYNICTNLCGTYILFTKSGLI